MTGRPDHAAARWADDADGGVEEPSAASVTGVGSQEADAPVQGGSAAPDGGAAGVAAGAGAAANAAAQGAGVGDGPILTDVAALTAQRDEYLESLQRLMADFDNYRKRVARLQEEQAARAEAKLVGKLLPVLDNLDLAWTHLGPRHADGEAEGEGGAVSEEARAIAQARAQLLDVLGKEGLDRLDAVGVPFDPTMHDAVAHTGGEERADVAGDDAASESAPHTVSVDEVLRAGYRWRGQVLRPAMVRVRG